MEIVLVRHAQSEANAAGVWQGRLDTDLTPAGRDQAELLGRRLRGRAFDLVVTSPLRRAEATAAAFADGCEPDPAWQEMDLGAWEGLSFEAVRASAGDRLAAIRAGEEIPFGGSGETLVGFEARILDALQSLASRLDRARVAVVTHGGVIDAVVGSILGRARDRRAFPIVANTSLTEVRPRSGGWQLRRFNDTAHLGSDSPWLADRRAEGTPVVGFVRHGITEANRRGVIQGQSCWGLDGEGLEQARRLADWYGPVDRVITSPLARARQTAEVLAGSGAVEESPEVTEIGCGAWEGLSYPEVLESDPDTAARIFDRGEDLPRGGTGETFAQVADRMERFLTNLVLEPAGRTLVVSHGGAIRSLVGSVTGAGGWARQVLATPDNSGVTHIALTAAGPVLADYSIAPHLEEPAVTVRVGR